jgi:acyl carrier protein
LGSELGVIELKHHKWLRDFDFDSLSRSQLISPIKPELKGKIDTSQFENFSCATIDDSPPDETSGWDNEF